MTHEKIKEFVEKQLETMDELGSLPVSRVVVICERLLQEQEREELQRDFRLAMEYLGRPDNPIPETTFGLLAGSYTHLTG